MKVFLGLTLSIVLLLPATATPQASGGSYVLRKQVIANGGNLAMDGGYVLTGSIGQPAAAVQSDGGYRLTGGFHQPRSVAATDAMFANGFE